MKKILKFPVLFLTAVLLFGCSSDDSDEDCMKTITIPQFYYVNGQSYSYDVTQKVSCNTPEPTEPTQIEPPKLEDFSYEVLKFEFTPDTGNNTSRLQFEIKLTNPNDHAVSGVPMLTMDVDGLQTKSSFSNNASVPCYEIAANSSCILTYDQQESLDVVSIDSYKLVNVQYYVTNKE
ncbi:hypothetical protein [Salinimicrobium terrae]|uniref:hypothetical protein n=1 Tax=Salinimicrobium terrae TaxID=470866 RepID=UPI0003FAE82C|nr:hypothetical protein [Salinimicrobium terrae]